MAQHKLRSRIAQFKHPFLVGAVTSVVLFSGCGELECPDATPTSGSACDEYEPGLHCAYNGDSGCQREFTCNDGAWDDVSPTCNPPPPELECPQAAPTQGEACEEHQPGWDCAYNDDSGCRREFTCNDGAWDDVSPTCNPPPPELECPDVTPAQGEACDEYEPGLDCPYNDESGCQREFTCNDGAWDDVSPTCNPPPPELECPQAAPTRGEACDEYEPGLDCPYNDESGCQREFTCNDGAWDDVSPTCNPPPPESECPEQRPRPGESCEGYELGLECETDVDQSSCPEASVLFCGSSGEWEGQPSSCNPPPPEPLTDCPTELPVPGDSCYGYEVWLTCGADASCDGGLSSICNADGVWEADIVFCNPPAVIGSEAGVDAAADARVDAGVDAGEPDGG